MTDVYKQDVEGFVSITDAGFFSIIDVQHRLSSFNEVGTVEGKVLPDDSASEPVEGKGAFLSINKEFVFDGIVRTFRRNEDGSYDITLASDVHRYKNTKTNVSISPGKAISKLVSNVLSGIQTNNQIIEPVDDHTLNYTFMRKDVPIADILDDLAKLSDSHWWVEPTNQFYFGNPADFSTTFVVQFPTKMSAGKETPAYKSVKVLGSPIEDTHGPEYNHMISKNSIQSNWTIEEGKNGKYNVRKAGGSPPGPVYTYRDRDIKKQAHADTVGKRICKQLAQQQIGGTLKFVGEEKIRPMDVVQMRPEFGGESYLVSGVMHELSSTDGFLTRVQCGGIVQR